jgi:tetratricopeptide (TPR) repeat protein
MTIRSPRRFPGPRCRQAITRLVLIASVFFPAVTAYSQTGTTHQSPANASADSSSANTALARARSANLDRHSKEAIRILRGALREHPGDAALELELGRVYLAIGANGQARQVFQHLLDKSPNDRDALLEMARVLSYQNQYPASDDLYRRLLTTNPADEAAAIGLTNNLIHEGHKAEASATADAALKHHPSSLRLLEYKDRISSGLLGGDERALPAPENVLTTSTDYVNDSAGNHSWRATERLEIRLQPGLVSDLHLEQQALHGIEDPLEVVETFSETLHWRPRERISLTVGGGAVHFDTNSDVAALYEVSLAGLVANHLLVGGGFSRIPIAPDAEAAEFRLTAQGWEAFTIWTPAHWQVSLRASRRHYSDERVGAQQSADIVHQWTKPKANFTAGYRFRHFGFSPGVVHGYFSPDNYQSHQAVLGASFRPTRWYRAELTGRAGAESIASGADFQRAWDITARNQLFLRNWEVSLSYSRFDISQFSGAFIADAARFELAYHF